MSKDICPVQSCRPDHVNEPVLSVLICSHAQHPHNLDYEFDVPSLPKNFLPGHEHSSVYVPLLLLILLQPD